MGRKQGKGTTEMRKISKKQTLLTGAVAVVLVGTGTAAYAYWTSQGTGEGTATTASAATALTVQQTSTVTGMYPGDSSQPLVVKVTNPGPNKAQVAGVRAVVTVAKAEGAPAGTCDPSDYQVNDTQLASDGQVDLNWTPTELESAAFATSANSVHFYDKTSANQDACKGATVTFSYTAQ